MAEVEKNRVAKWLRRAAAAAVLVLALAVSVLIFRSRPAPPAGKETPVPPARQKVDEKVSIRYVEFRGEREKVEFLADRSYRDTDDLYHLAGNVRIIDYGRMGGFRVSLSGREVVHDADRVRYAFVGPVVVEFKGLTLRTTDLVYHRRTETCRTEGRVRFESDRLRGEAVGLSYSLRDYDLTLDAELAMDLGGDGSNPPLSIVARSLIFHQDERKGEIRGPVTIVHGRSRASCRSLDFELFARTDRLSIVYLRGDVRMALRGEFSGRPPEGGARSLAELGNDQEIEAQEVKLRAFLDSAELHSFEATGRSSIRFSSAPGGWTLFRGNHIGFILDRESGLREFRALGLAHMEQKDAGSEEERSASGESIILPGDSDWLQVRVEAGSRARAAMGKTEILAEALDFGLKKKDFEARGAKAVLSARAQDRAVGFFAPEVPSFALSEVMRYFAEEKRFYFQGDVRIWQEGKTLRASEFEFWEDTGRAAGRGRVRAVFPHKPENREKEEKIEISADRLSSSPEDGVMTFAPGAILKLERAEVKAGSIEVRLGEESRRMETMTARGEVVILQPGREARGGLAVYQADQDTIVLTGRPVLIDKDKGRVEGDKLTFRLSDGTITVENSGRERSVTIIKS